MNKPFGECIWILEAQSSHQLVRFVSARLFDSLKFMRLWSQNILEIILSVLFLQMRKLKQDNMAYLGDINWWNFTESQLLGFSVYLFFFYDLFLCLSIKLPLIWKKKNSPFTHHLQEMLNGKHME